MKHAIEKFISLFTYIEAAGGLIHSPKGNLLMIHRFSKWDLPKGKLEKGESAQQAAVRECMEETGLEDITVVRELDSTYHIYHVNNKHCLKRTYWFEMKTSAEMRLIPQIEEGIEKVLWLNRSQVMEAIENTYASLMDMINHYYLEDHV